MRNYYLRKPMTCLLHSDVILYHVPEGVTVRGLHTTLLWNYMFLQAGRSWPGPPPLLVSSLTWKDAETHAASQSRPLSPRITHSPPQRHDLARSLQPLDLRRMRIEGGVGRQELGISV